MHRTTAWLLRCFSLTRRGLQVKVDELDCRLRSRIAAVNTTMMRRIVTALAIASAAALSTTTAPRPVTTAAAPGDHDVLLRAARGEKTERTPVWLMRQAGRYMADFRKYSDKIRSDSGGEKSRSRPELSLQCWRAFGVDGVIMFSDILTILPALGIEFDVVKGKGPQIEDTPRTAERVAQFEADAKKFDPSSQLPFVAQTLKNLRQETEGKTTLVGFVGAPWTLCAYACEGGSTRHCLNIKEMMRDDPATAHRYLDAMADSVAEHAVLSDRERRADGPGVRELGAPADAVLLRGVRQAVCS